MKTIMSMFLLACCLASFASTPEAKVNEQLLSVGQSVQSIELELFNQALNAAKDHHGPCSKVELTEDQKEALKEAVFQLKRKMIQLKADGEVAHLDYVHVLMNTNSQKQEATDASTALVGAMAKNVEAHLSFVNDVLYDILTADQRKPALMCLHYMKRMQMAAKKKKLCSKKGPIKVPPPKPGKP